MKQDIAVIGLSVMGSNLALNMADHGYQVAIYNRTTSVIDEVLASHPHANLKGHYSLGDVCANLTSPRKIMLMIKAGAAVDGMVEQLLPYLEPGDIIIDGGNSYFKDSERRYQYLKEKKIHFFGVGVSGGEKGARLGPAIMPGGDAEAYRHIQPILEDISAKVGDDPCCTYIATGGAGHYVKMVHNGIEYADMQLIVEAYRLLKELGGFTNQELAAIFHNWNEGELHSYLIGITARIFETKDPESTQELIDMIVDKASQKGTGKWVNLEAIELGVDISLITAAVNARFMSNQLEHRINGSKVIKRPEPMAVQDTEALIELVRASLYAGKIAAYAQGFKLLEVAGKEYNWQLPFGQIASIFRGGCIIQAKFLENIVNAYERNANLSNLIFDEFFLQHINQSLDTLRNTLVLAIQHGIAVTALSNALAYLDTYATQQMGANLIQAQRDFFGAHTFERFDRPGNFHYDWEGLHE